jgi:hypothetical protein
VTCPLPYLLTLDDVDKGEQKADQREDTEGSVFEREILDLVRFAKILKNFAERSDQLGAIAAFLPHLPGICGST